MLVLMLTVLSSALTWRVTPCWLVRRGKGPQRALTQSVPGTEQLRLRVKAGLGEAVTRRDWQVTGPASLWLEVTWQGSQPQLVGKISLLTSTFSRS